MNDLDQLIERYVNIYVKCKKIEVEIKDLHNKNSEKICSSMLSAANQMKLSISNEIEKNISALSMDELYYLLNAITERKNSNNESYKMSKLPYYLSCEYYYKYCAYNELIDFINYKSQNMVFK